MPRPVRVRIPTTLSEGIVAKEGEIVWLLESVGEGYVRVWRDGVLADVDDPAAWSEPAGAPLDEDRHWWVRLRTASGVVGWCDNSDQLFDGFDGCG